MSTTDTASCSSSTCSSQNGSRSSSMSDLSSSSSSSSSEAGRSDTIERDPDDLEDGDHVYKTRYNFNYEGQEYYAYTHHGVYCKGKKPFVIGFTLTALGIPEPTQEFGNFPVEGYVLDFLTFIKSFNDFSVEFESVDSFKDEKSGKVKVYRYSAPVDIADCAESADGVCEVPALNGAKAADLARFFAKKRNGKLFGQYRFRDWNCEHFATFCKTTTLDVADLERHWRSLPSDSPLDMTFLMENSSCQSLQADRFIAGGYFHKRDGCSENADEVDTGLPPLGRVLASEFSMAVTEAAKVWIYW